jgi:excinuclease ABC subunit C
MSLAITKSLRLIAEKLPTSPGVYLWRDSSNRILYIGKAKNLRRRVLSYFRCPHPKVKKLLQSAHTITHQVCKTDADAFYTEQVLIAEWKPKYNVLAREGLRFVALTWTKQRFPVLILTPCSNPVKGQSYLSNTARALLYYLKTKYGVLSLTDAQPVLHNPSEETFCLYPTVYKDLISQEFAYTTEANYQNRVSNVTQFLSLNLPQKLSHIKSDMSKAASELKFEQAAKLRDLNSMLTLSGKTKLHVSLRDSTGKTKAMAELSAALGILPAPITMDCFDISHFSGTLVVASCVRFKDGAPDKQNYRKFKLSQDTNDDYLSMQEVVYRRYKSSGVPDLIVIDGGEGQVNAAMKAFRKLKKTPKHIIGLEKQFETIVFADKRKPLQLGAYHNGLKALQRLRDEAHRFANQYGAKLRSAKIKESGSNDPK